jgi:hypothetical protein
MVQITNSDQQLFHKCPERVEHHQIMTALIHRVCAKLWRMNSKKFCHCYALYFVFECFTLQDIYQKAAGSISGVDPVFEELHGLQF